MTEGKHSLDFLRPEHADALRTLILPHDYTEATLRDRFGFSMPQAFDPLSLDIEQRKMSGYSGLELLARFFLLGDAIPREDLAAFPPSDVDACIAAGWFVEGDAGLMATALIGSIGSLLVASDRYESLHPGAGFEHVLTVNPVARNLVKFMVRKPCGRTLDLCGGGGIQALFAAGHAEQVVSTDLNPRATAFAAFNARLNLLDHIEARTGAGLEPVAGEQFDQIVCNPPFVMTPSRRHVCTDNPKDLDEFSRDILRDAAAHLAPGGLLQIITEWVELEGEDWPIRIISWMHGLGCDVFILKCNTEPPSGYVRSRLREAAQVNAEVAPFTYGEWLDYFLERKVRNIYGGLIFLQRHAEGEQREPMVHIDDFDGNVNDLVGQVVSDTFERMRMLIPHDVEFKDLHLSIPDHVRLAQQAAPTPKGWQADRGVLMQNEGLSLHQEVDGSLAQLLRFFDGSRSNAELVAQFVGYGATEEQIVPIIRNLFKRGFLTVHGG